MLSEWMIGELLKRAEHEKHGKNWIWGIVNEVPSSLELER